MSKSKLSPGPAALGSLRQTFFRDFSWLLEPLASLALLPPHLLMHHSNLCPAFTCLSSLCLVPLFHLLFSEEHLSVDLGPTWSAHHDLMLNDSFGKVLFPSKFTVGIFWQTFIGGEGDTMGSPRILYHVLKVICSAVAECIVLSMSSTINLVDM